jgi:hypothetical protein
MSDGAHGPTRRSSHEVRLPYYAHYRAMLTALEADLTQWYTHGPFTDVVARLAAYRGVAGRSTYGRSGPPGSRHTTWFAQILSSSVRLDAAGLTVLRGRAGADPPPSAACGGRPRG